LEASVKTGSISGHIFNIASRSLAAAFLLTNYNALSCANGLCCSAKGYAACVEADYRDTWGHISGHGNIKIARFGHEILQADKAGAVQLDPSYLIGIRCLPQTAEVFTSTELAVVHISTATPFQVQSKPLPKGLPAEGFIDAENMYICGNYTRLPDEALESDDPEHQYRLTTLVNAEKTTTQIDQLDRSGRKIQSIPLIEGKIAPCPSEADD
jgi:hypothetical protein